MIDDIILNWDDVPDEDKLVMNKAVYYHSDFALPDDLTTCERLFCGIIREADKLDIFCVMPRTIYGFSRAYYQNDGH